jgi:hypothetical protein
LNNFFHQVFFFNAIQIQILLGVLAQVIVEQFGHLLQRHVIGVNVILSVDV